MAVHRLLLVFSIAALFALHSSTLKANETTYCLRFKNLNLSPNERLSKFELNITSGIVVGFPRVPLDWRIAIDNEANWRPVISGNAIHQAADLEQREFENSFLRVAGVPSDLVKSGMTRAMTVTGYLQLSYGDTKRTLPISNRNIALTPERRCRRNG